MPPQRSLFSNNIGWSGRDETGDVLDNVAPWLASQGNPQGVMIISLRKLLQTNGTSYQEAFVSGATATVFLAVAGCLTLLAFAFIVFSYLCLRLTSRNSTPIAAALEGGDELELNQRSHHLRSCQLPITPVPLIEINTLHAAPAKGEACSPRSPKAKQCLGEMRIVVVQPDDDVILGRQLDDGSGGSSPPHIPRLGRARGLAALLGRRESGPHGVSCTRSDDSRERPGQ